MTLRSLCQNEESWTIRQVQLMVLRSLSLKRNTTSNTPSTQRSDEDSFYTITESSSVDESELNVSPGVWMTTMFCVHVCVMTMNRMVFSFSNPSPSAFLRESVLPSVDACFDCD